MPHDFIIPQMPYELLGNVYGDRYESDLTVADFVFCFVSSSCLFTGCISQNALNYDSENCKAANEKPVVHIGRHAAYSGGPICSINWRPSR